AGARCGGRGPCVAEVGQGGQQEEERAEDIAAFGDPCDRFDAERVEGEEQCRGGGGQVGGGGCRTVARAEQAEGEAVDQHGVQRVDQHVDRVVADWVQLPQRVLECVRDPR